MDRNDLEPCNGLRQGLAGLQELLCRTYGQATDGYGRCLLYGRIQANPPTFPARHGPGVRPMREAWAQDIRVQCENQNAQFFFKQWGGVRKERFGRELNGRTYDDMPTRPVIALVPVRAAA